MCMRADGRTMIDCTDIETCTKATSQPTYRSASRNGRLFPWDKISSVWGLLFASALKSAMHDYRPLPIEVSTTLDPVSRLIVPSPQPDSNEV